MWLDQDWRCPDIGLFAAKRRRGEEGQKGRGEAVEVELGSFFDEYPHDAIYVTREEERAQRSA